MTRLALRLLHVFGVAALLLLALGLVLESGKRGFLAADQSILFDGGYRVALGQVPYRDFFIPTGPVPFWIQGLFFAGFGVSYGTYILHAAVINAAVALLALLWFRTVFPQSRLHGYFAAVLTAFWFYPPFGTPWFEQTAFFFHFAAMFLLVRSLAAANPSWRSLRMNRRGYLLLVAAGLADGLSFLCKQNAGLLAVAASLGVLGMGVSARLRQRLVLATCFAAGVALAFVSFATWLLFASNVDLFRLFFLEIPSQEGLRRLGQLGAMDLLSGAFSMTTPVRTFSALSAVVAAGVFLTDGYLRVTGRDGPLAPQGRMAAGTLLSLFVLQSVFIPLTVNEPENGFSFCGMMVALAMLLVRDMSPNSLGSEASRRATPFAVTYWLGSLLMFFALAQQARSVALNRGVHDVFSRSRFDANVVSRAMHPVQWAIPTPAARRSEEEIPVEDIDRLTEFLRRSEDFFVFPDFTVLYGLVGATPPQPLLWFHRGLTYSLEKAPWLDRRLVQELHERRVEYVVVEAVSLGGTDRRLAHFPSLARYIADGFEPEREFGIFRVLRRRAR
ncbi:MAG TPA: hypothetical protein VEK15_04275 [Vicinamibacteria bacterium]|nr:hypothetical protein [Vicinamibacteria bacterium]